MQFLSRFCLAICTIALFSFAHASSVRLGVSLPPTASSSPSAIGAALDMAQQSGAKRVRIAANWPAIQPTANAWNFSALDGMIRAAEARKIEVVLVLGPSPRWAVSYLGANPGAAEVSRAKPNLPAYRVFAAAIAKRYRQRVAYYQLWERPSSSTLLALPRDVFAIYRAGAGAIHGVDPSLRVVAPESCGVDLSWIAEYMQSAKGTERADVIQLTPRATMSPASFAWHVQVLRERVLPKQGAPQLWVSCLVENEDRSVSNSNFSMALLLGINDLFTEESDGHATSVTECMAFLSPLQGLEFRGWTQFAPGIYGGQFGNNQRELKTLILPLKGGALSIAPSTAQPSASLLAIGSSVTVRAPGRDPQVLIANTATSLPLEASCPLILEGVTCTPTPGSLNYRPVPVSGNTVSLDLSDGDPAKIHLLRDLPGGRFSLFTSFDRTVVSTLKDTAPWIHADIPDGFLFYNVQRTPVEVTVEVMGTTAKKKNGFNLYYDAVGGMRNSTWQWIDVGTKESFTYTFRLNDAIFAGREGYDLRVNMGGSDDNVRLVGMTVRKL